MLDDDDLALWVAGLDDLFALVAGRFPRVEPRLRARAYVQQIVHQTTHSLARFFLEIDANYKQFKTASRLRAAAAQRLLQDKIQRAEVGQFVTFDLAFHEVAEMALDAFRGNFAQKDRIVGFVVSDYADVTGVALIAGACVCNAR